MSSDEQRTTHIELFDDSTVVIEELEHLLLVKAAGFTQRLEGGFWAESKMEIRRIGEQPADRVDVECVEVSSNVNRPVSKTCLHAIELYVHIERRLRVWNIWQNLTLNS